MSTDVLKQVVVVVFFSCRVLSSSQRFASVSMMCNGVFPRGFSKTPPFFLFLNPKPYCVLFRVLFDTLNPKKRHSLLFVTKKHFWGGDVSPIKPRAFYGALCRSGPPPRLKNLFFPKRVFLRPPPRAPKPPVIVLLFSFCSFLCP